MASAASGPAECSEEGEGAEDVPVGDDGAGGPAADDDEVVLRPHVRRLDIDGPTLGVVQIIVVVSKRC